MQKQVLDALAQDTSADGFTQLIWSNDSGRQAVSERRAAKAKQLRRDFWEQVEKVVPDTVLCSAVFSPHALIDEIYANLECAGNVNKVFKMMLQQGPFLSVKSAILSDQKARYRLRNYILTRAIFFNSNKRTIHSHWILRWDWALQVTQQHSFLE